MHRESKGQRGEWIEREMDRVGEPVNKGKRGKREDGKCKEWEGTKYTKRNGIDFEQ